MKFNKKLKNIMESKGINQVALANAIGKSKGSVSQYLSGQHAPNRNTMKRISEFLEVSIEELTSDEEVVVDENLVAISVNNAAKKLNVSPQFVRLALQQGTAPFGFAVKNSRWSYHISLKKLNEYVGGDI